MAKTGGGKNIKVPGLDQLAEIAKEFLQKVIFPSAEEVGGLFSDRVKLWRFKNQISVVTKAEDYLKQNNITTKKVSVKVMAPLLEQCSLEEDESIKEKWTALLINTVKTGSGIENSLYSTLLSQLSSEDAKILELIYRASVQSHSNNGTTVWVHQDAIISLTQVRKDNPEAGLSIDNLIRLRLIKETSSSIPDSPVMITQLGVRFVINCTLP